jgi:hypothetical protein
LSESELQAHIRLAIGRVPHARLFRNNRGLFWAGKVIASTEDTVTLLHPRRQECGLLQGASDLIGWTSVVVTPDMVGHLVGLFTAGEVKPRGGRFEMGQREFLAAVAAAGGLSAVLGSDDDARRLVRAA